MEIMKKRIVIAGGGASGLMAAIQAAGEGASVTVLEHNEKPGKKLNATGNGKCNLTNLAFLPDAYRGTDPSFAAPALSAFSVQDTIKFFSRLGIYTINKNGGIYPHSGQAASVTEVLCMEAKNLGVKIKTKEHVKEVRREQGIWKTYTEGWCYESDGVILANGSNASQISGADGSGYDLAAKLGHRIIPPLPALTALKCQGRPFKWDGVRTNGQVTLCLNGIPLKTQQGELQLTEYGVSGIPVFQISRYAIRALKEGCEVSLILDFLPEFSMEAMEDFLMARRKNCPYKTEKELLIGLFPSKLIQILTSRRNLIEAIKAFPLKVTAGLDFSKAQVCSGGVDTGQVDPFTMESKLMPGLYFAGELLDIDGTCGGYNLQWAWSSGAAAGRHAGKRKDTP